MTEVRCHDQASMDVLVRTPGHLIAVEAKLSNWNKVIAQAYLHRYCVDFLYVAVPENLVTEKRLAEATRFGIGVLAISDGSARVRRQAPQCQPSVVTRERLITNEADTRPR